MGAYGSIPHHLRRRKSWSRWSTAWCAASLERLCRYVGRPPVATERLSRLEDGRLLYELRHRWKDGTTHVAFEPLELIDRLEALVPPPRWHTVRYYGVLASRSKLRARIVPGEEAPVRDSCTPAGSICVESDAGGLKDTTSLGPGAGTHNTGGATRPSRYYSWPELMRRVFEIDVLQCPRCQASPMRILAAIHPPTTTVAILKSMGLPTRAPPIAPARAVGSDWTLAESPSIFSHDGSRPAA